VQGREKGDGFLRMLTPLDARELKAHVSLVVYAAEFTKLRRSGRQLIGLCPIHSERHPSFYVHPEKQVLKCFECGAGGDIFEFIMRVTDCDCRTALEIVAHCSEGGSSRQRPAKRVASWRERRGAAPQPAEGGRRHSQSAEAIHARSLAALAAADRRQRAIETTDRGGDRWKPPIAKTQNV
jgi:DNA primase